MSGDASKVDLKQSNQQWGLRQKLRRGLWELCWVLLFRPTPKRLGNPWRLWLLRRFGAIIEGDALVLPSCRNPATLGTRVGRWRRHRRIG